MTYSLTATKLSMLGKKGVSTPDADGYYTLVIGALNSSNNSGSWYYTAEGVKALFDSSSLLQRKVKNGALLAEVGHPTQKPGENMADFTARYLDIDLKNVCGHIRKVWLDEEFGRNNPQYNNPAMIAIMGEVRPEEPFGNLLKSALENNSRNACFSIRGFAEEEIRGGRVVRTLREIIGFDWVNEGGLTVASKWDSPCTESIDNSDIILPVTQKILTDISEASKSGSSVIATESSVHAASLLLSRHMSEARTPIYGKW